MSYVVSIRRKLPITEQDLIAAIDGDRYFSIADTDELTSDLVVLHWREQADSAKVNFVLHRGVIDITTPSSSALEAAQSLAVSLGAEVFGEEGEDLSNFNVPDNVAVGCGPFVWAILGIGALLVVYWLIE